MSVPTCKSCAHRIKAWTGREFDHCDLSDYASVFRQFGCGPQGRYWTPKPTLWERLGLKASQTRFASDGEARTRASEPATEPKGQDQ